MSDVLEVLEHHLCTAMAHEGQPEGGLALHNALALVQSLMCGSADLAWVSEQAQSLRATGRLPEVCDDGNPCTDADAPATTAAPAAGDCDDGDCRGTA